MAAGGGNDNTDRGRGGNANTDRGQAKLAKLGLLAGRTQPEQTEENEGGVTAIPAFMVTGQSKGLKRTKGEMEAKEQVDSGRGGGGGGEKEAGVVAIGPLAQRDDTGQGTTICAYSQQQSDDNDGGVTAIPASTISAAKYALSVEQHQQPLMKELHRKDGVAPARLNALQYIDSGELQQEDNSNENYDNLQPSQLPPIIGASQPGAYSNSTEFSGAERRGKLQYTLFGVQSQSTGNEEHRTINPSSSNGHADLALAMPVEDPSVLDTNVQPVDMDAVEEKKTNQEKQLKKIILITVFLVCASKAIALGFMLPRRINNNKSG